MTGRYNAIIALDPQGCLQLRDYIGLPIFGRTQTLAPYAGQMVADCRLPEDAGNLLILLEPTLRY